MDDGAYYANFHGYGKQDHGGVGILGRAFYRGRNLANQNPSNTPTDKPPFIIKNLTPEIIQTALGAEGQLACIPGFLKPEYERDQPNATVAVSAQGVQPTNASVLLTYSKMMRESHGLTRLSEENT